MSSPKTNGVVVLFKGGRLPSWHQLSDKERSEFEQTHVNLMLSIAEQHGMTRLEGFRLIGRQGDWPRFWRIEGFGLLSPQADWHWAWIIELPTLEAAEAWVEAEEALPHGMHAHRTIHLARKWAPEYFANWTNRN
jgi:hypothetical protein